MQGSRPLTVLVVAKEAALVSSLNTMGMMYGKAWGSIATLTLYNQEDVHVFDLGSIRRFPCPKVYFFQMVMDT